MADQEKGRPLLSRAEIRELMKAARELRSYRHRVDRYLSVSVTVYDDGTWTCYMTAKVGDDLHVRTLPLDTGQTEAANPSWLAALLADQASMLADHVARTRVLPS